MSPSNLDKNIKHFDRMSRGGKVISPYEAERTKRVSIGEVAEWLKAAAC